MYGPSTNMNRPSVPRRRPLPLPSPSTASTVTSFEPFSRPRPASQLSQSSLISAWTDEDEEEEDEHDSPPLGASTSAAHIPSPLPLDFDHPQVPWSGLRLPEAQATLSSPQLQSLVSRAIRAFSDDAVRLLLPDVLDKAIPAEVARLEAHKAAAQAQFRFLSNRRTNLLRSLHAISTSKSSPDLRALPALTRQLADVSSTIDTLTIELLHTADRRAQLDRLTDIHNASALSVALRKLNASVSKRSGELQQLRAKVAAMAEELRAKEESENEWLFTMSDSGETLDTAPPTPRTGKGKESEVSPLGMRPPPPRPLMLSSRAHAPHLFTTATPISSPGPPAYEQVSSQTVETRLEKTNMPTPTSSPPRPQLSLINTSMETLPQARTPHEPIVVPIATDATSIAELPPLSIPLDARRLSLTRPSPLSVSPASAVSYIEADADGQVVVLNITGRAVAAQATYTNTPPSNASSSRAHRPPSSGNSSSDYHSGGSSLVFTPASFDTPLTSASSSSGSSTRTVHVKSKFNPSDSPASSSSPLRIEISSSNSSAEPASPVPAAPTTRLKHRPQHLQSLRVPPVRMPGGKIMIHQGSATPSPATSLSSAMESEPSSRSHVAHIERAMQGTAVSKLSALRKSTSVVSSGSGSGSGSSEDSGSNYSSGNTHSTPSSSGSSDRPRSESSQSSIEPSPSNKTLKAKSPPMSAPAFPQIEISSPFSYADDEDDVVDRPTRRRSSALGYGLKTTDGLLGLPKKEKDRYSQTMHEGEVSSFADHYMTGGLTTGVSSFGDHYLSAYPPATGAAVFPCSAKSGGIHGPSTADIYGFYDAPHTEDDRGISPASFHPPDSSALIANYYFSSAPLASPAALPISPVLPTPLSALGLATANEYAPGDLDESEPEEELGLGAQHYPPEPLDVPGGMAEMADIEFALDNAAANLHLLESVADDSTGLPSLEVPLIEGEVIAHVPVQPKSSSETVPSNGPDPEVDEAAFGDKLSLLITETDEADRRPRWHLIDTPLLKQTALSSPVPLQSTALVTVDLDPTAVPLPPPTPDIGGVEVSL